MKKCKSCQKSIDNKANKCPFCQTDQRNWFLRHPIWTGLLVLFTIGIVASASSGNKGNSSNQQTRTTTDVTTPKQEVPQEPSIIEATALVADFDQNKLAANDKYTNKLIQTTGYIKNISNDVTGQYYLSLNPTNEKYYFGTSLSCYFKEKGELTSLSNGQSVTVRGTMQAMTLGIINMKDCQVVN